MGRDVAQRLAETAPDVVFNALHGVPGEDGTVQGMMDLMGLTYTHSGMVTSVIAIDKELTKQALVPHGIPMPGGRIVIESESLYRRRSAAAALCAEAGQRRIVGRRRHRHREGNIGNPISARCQGAVAGIRPTLLAEPFIRGRELTTAVLGDEALMVTELRPKSGFYDFDAKYTDGMTEHVCPAEIPEEITLACKDLALRCAPAARLQGHQPFDFRWDDDAASASPGCSCLETNTQPGMTAAQPGARTGGIWAFPMPIWSRRGRHGWATGDGICASSRARRWHCPRAMRPRRRRW
jgi:D-alanine-D-alanine ligase